MKEQAAPSTYMSPRFATATFGDREVKLYPVSVELFFQLKDIAGPLVRALAEVMSGDTGDVSVEERQTFNAGGLTGTERIICAISPELYAAKAERRDAALQAAVEHLLSEKTKLVVGRLLVDCMRDEPGCGPEAAKNNGVVLKFLAGIDLPSAMTLLKACGEANEEVLAPFKRALPPEAKAAIERMKTPAPKPADASEKSASERKSDEPLDGAPSQETAKEEPQPTPLRRV